MNKLKMPRYIQWTVLTGITFLFLMSLLRVLLILSFHTPSGDKAPFFPVLVLGMRYDLRDVCIACLIIFFMGTIPPLHPFEKKLGRKVSFAIWTILIIVFVIFYTVDFASYAYLFQRLRANLLNLLQNAKTSLGLIWENYHVILIIVLLTIIIASLLDFISMLYETVLSKPKLTTKRGRIIWSIIFFLLLGFGIFGRLDQYPLRWSDAYSFENDYAANIALNPFQSFFSTLEFRRVSYDTSAVKKAYPLMARYLGVNTPDSDKLDFERVIIPQESTQISHPNIVIVICESLSAFKSSMYGNPLNTTPFFNQLCKQGIFFNRCFAPSFGTARGGVGHYNRHP